MMPRVTAPDRIFTAPEVDVMRRRKYRRPAPATQDVATEFWLSATAWYGWAKRRAVPIAFIAGVILGYAFRAGADDAISVSLPSAAAQAGSVAAAVQSRAAKLAMAANLARRDALTEYVKGYNPRLSYEQCEAVVDVALT